MFEPAAVLYGDVPSAYLATFNSTVPASVFTDDGYLGRFTQAAVSPIPPSLLRS